VAQECPGKMQSKDFSKWIKQVSIPTHIKDPGSLGPWQALVFSIFFTFSHSDGHKVVSLCSFNLYFSDD
jgi:hypothetical protein